MNLRQLSRFVPVRMTSTYWMRQRSGTSDFPDPGKLTLVRRERASWWQWRDRIWRHRRQEVAS